MIALENLARAVLRMGQLAVMRRELCWVTRDRSGGWRHRYRDGVMVTSRPREGSWKRFEAATLELYCWQYRPRPGDTIVEVGAGTGTETIFLSRMVGDTGRVVAVEASPHAARLLRRTIQENRLVNVTVVEAAVTADPGTVKIFEPFGPGDIRDSLFYSEGRAHDVRAVTVDDLLAEQGIDAVDLLKVNIEGAEKPMLDGMASASKRIRHAVICCHDFIAELGDYEMMRTKQDVRIWLEAHGFTVTGRDGDTRPWVRDTLYAADDRC